MQVTKERASELEDRAEEQHKQSRGKRLGWKTSNVPVEQQQKIILESLVS